MLYYSEYKDILNLNDKTIIPIIPVNCVGVMGAGLALQFKEKYPHLYTEYVEACNNKEIEIGHILYLKNDKEEFILFPTKDHWKNDSNLEYIELGLNGLVNFLDTFPTKKVAIPPIGCGCGKLSVDFVLPLIYEKTKECKNDIFLVGF